MLWGLCGVLITVVAAWYSGQCEESGILQAWGMLLEFLKNQKRSEAKDDVSAVCVQKVSTFVV